MMDGETFRARGGVRIRGSRWTQHASRPFASLVATRSFIIIESLVGTARISREHVRLIEPYQHWWTTGVRFCSDEDGREVVFWTTDPESIIDALRILGWDATDESQ
jgi:hypothetical protein